MKILLTGSKGFIGFNLLNEIQNDEILEINEDIFNDENWVLILQKKLDDFRPDVIFHVGACSNTLETDVNYMMTRNFEFTKILTDWSVHSLCKLIYSSSAANYGTNNLYPSNLYGWSKYVAEQYVVSKGGVALRYFNVYGPKEAHKGVMSSVAYQMLEKYKKGEEIKIFPLHPKRDFVYVKDVVSANLFAMENYNKLAYSYYEVGSGVARTFEDVLEIMKIPYTYTKTSDIPNGYQFYTKSNHEKWMPNWKPIWQLEDGLKDYFQKDLYIS